MDISVLEDIGLSTAEIKVYLALLELGTVKASPILERSGLQNSVVHLTLNKLVRKGLVSFVRRGRVKYYQASDPQNIIRFIDEKKTRFEAVLPLLLEKQQLQEKQEAQVFEGFNGFKSMLYESIEDAEPGDEFLFFSFSPLDLDAYKKVFDFYKIFEEERIRRGLIVKGIAPTALKHLFAGRRLENILFVDFPTVLNLSVVRNKVIMTPAEETQISFLVTSRQLADNFRRYFYSIWDQYKQ